MAFLAAACGHSVEPSNSPSSANAAVANAATSSAHASAQVTVAPADEAPPASQTGGFDGAKAYDFTAKLVAFGPRPPASDAL